MLNNAKPGQKFRMRNGEVATIVENDIMDAFCYPIKASFYNKSTQKTKVMCFNRIGMAYYDSPYDLIEAIEDN